MESGNGYRLNMKWSSQQKQFLGSIGLLNTSGAIGNGKTTAFVAKKMMLAGYTIEEIHTILMSPLRNQEVIDFYLCNDFMLKKKGKNE